LAKSNQIDKRNTVVKRILVIFQVVEKLLADVFAKSTVSMEYVEIKYFFEYHHRAIVLA